MLLESASDKLLQTLNIIMFKTCNDGFSNIDRTLRALWLVKTPFFRVVKAFFYFLPTLSLYHKTDEEA